MGNEACLSFRKAVFDVVNQPIGYANAQTVSWDDVVGSLMLNKRSQKL